MIRDILGHDFDFAAPPRRVVSLVPSLTETLFELGVEDAVAGITDFCIFPPGLQCARFGGTKTPAIARLRELAPDLVYVNLEENLKRHADEIATFAPVFATEPKTVDNVVELITMLGRIHDRREKAAELVASINAERQTANHFSFLVPIWKKPWMWCGGDTYVSNLVESTGARNLMRNQKRYPTMDLKCALALEPEVVFLPDEPYAFTEADAEEIRASTNASVIGPFPGHLFTWHGVRTREGLRFLHRSFATPR